MAMSSTLAISAVLVKPIDFRKFAAVRYVGSTDPCIPVNDAKINHRRLNMLTKRPANTLAD